MADHFVIFENDGEIDARLIGAFGVNVKENDSAIGFFGTGLKYALAILTRTDHGVTIQSGETTHAFERQPTTIRGKDFEFVAMDGQALGFTTEIGKTWELWMAYRELFCNCQDEGGQVYEADAAPEPTAGKTRVVVSGHDFATVRANHSSYFVTSRPLWSNDRLEVHDGPSDGIYYKDVLIGRAGNGYPSLYSYNLRCHVDLTEDRTARHPFLLDDWIARELLRCDDPEVIQRAVMASQHTLEGQMNFEQPVTASAEFLEIVGEAARHKSSKVNASAIRAYEKQTESTAEPEPIDLTSVERKSLDKALEFCRSLGFQVDYPVHVVESLGPGVLGRCRRGKVYLSRRAFMCGTKQVAGTLIEEHLHLRHDFEDGSRQMQNYLLDRLVSVGEQVVGEPL